MITMMYINIYIYLSWIEVIDLTHLPPGFFFFFVIICPFININDTYKISK